MNTVVPEFWDVPQQIRERFGETAGKQRAMFAEGHLVLVLHAPPRATDSQRIARLFWRSPDGAWSSNCNGSGEQVLRRHLAEYAQLTADFEIELQQARFADDYFQALNELTRMHRAARNLHSTLQQAREMVDEDKEIIVARDASADVERSLELLHLDAKNGLDFTVAQRAEQQSQRSYEMAVSAHRLNILAALFFPLTALGSLFGMNLASGLENATSSSLFWGILGVGFSSGLILTRVISSKPAKFADQTTGTALTSSSKQTSASRNSKSARQKQRLYRSVYSP